MLKQKLAEVKQQVSGRARVQTQVYPMSVLSVLGRDEEGGKPES